MRRKYRLAAAVVALLLLAGCGQSATQQMRAQTDDPGMVALATYADALEAYVAAQEIYLPYQQTIRARYPQIDADVIACFKRAREILRLWKAAGGVDAQDKHDFREALRQVSLLLAGKIDEEVTR